MANTSRDYPMAELDSLDFEKEFLRDCFALVDARISKLETYVDPSDPESDCYIFDPMDHILGVGFVAAQRYVASVCGWFKVPKGDALRLGPKHSSGVSIAEIVNAAANFRKHCEEPDTGIRESTKKILTSIGVDHEGSYVVSNILAQIGIKKISELMISLIAWRDSVIAYLQHTSP